MRTTGTYVTTTTLGEVVRAFVPCALPPADPPLAADSYVAANHRAEMALARLAGVAGVAGLVPSVDWLIYSAIRKEALTTSQIEGTQATLTDLFDDEAGQVLANTADVEEVTNYLRACRLVRDNLRSDNKGYAQLDLQQRLSNQNKISAHLTLSTGYGDSLLDYNHATTVLGVGISVGD